jgi:hypothetical protein
MNELTLNRDVWLQLILFDDKSNLAKSKKRYFHCFNFNDETEHFVANNKDDDLSGECAMKYE